MNKLSTSIPLLCLSFVTLFGCVREPSYTQNSFVEEKERVKFKTSWQWRNNDSKKEKEEMEAENNFDSNHEIWKKKQNYSQEMTERNNLKNQTDFVGSNKG